MTNLSSALLQATEFFVFAILMALMVVIFGIMAHFYTSVDITTMKPDVVVPDDIHLVSHDQMSSDLSDYADMSDSTTRRRGNSRDLNEKSSTIPTSDTPSIPSS